MHNDFFRILESEHRKVTQIIGTIMDASGPKLGGLYTDLKKELLPHLKAEETTLYPRLEAMQMTKHAAMEAVAEHHQIEKTVSDLDAVSTADKKWHDMMYVLSEQMANHSHTEETEIFDGARQNISEDDIAKIMDSYQTEKKDLVSSASY